MAGLFPLVISILLGEPAAGSAPACFFDDHAELALCAADGGVLEPAVPIFHNGVPVGLYKVVEAFDRVPGTGSFPLTLADIHANTFVRLTYQKSDGTTGPLGTSVVGSPSLRTPTGFRFIPTVSRGDVSTGVPGRYLSSLQGAFGADATVTTTRSFPDPSVGRTEVTVSVDFAASRDIALALDPPFPGNDRFRLLTVSSMFAGSTVFDANRIRYQDRDGATRTIALTEATPRGQHLLSLPDEIGAWMEIQKGQGSTWFPESPSLRIDVLDRGGLRLGLQGYLDSQTDPNADSLSVWLEWLDAPSSIRSGTVLTSSFRVSATTAPASYFTVAPCRVLDTRNPDGPRGGPALAAGNDRIFPIAGNCGIPSTAKAISVNLAVTGSTAAGNLRLHPAGTPLPLVSALNYSTAQTRSNNAVVSLSSQGELAVFCGQASGVAHLILDVHGFFP